MKSYRIGSVPDWIVAELAAREVPLEVMPRIAALPEDARLVLLGAPTVGAITAVAAVAPLAVVVACYGPDELTAAAAAADSDADDVVLEPTPPAARAARVALMLRHLCGRWAEAAVARHAAPSMVFRAAAGTGALEVVSDPGRRLDLTAPDLAQPWLAMVHPDDRDEAAHRGAAALAGEPQTFVHRVIDRHGERRWGRAELRRLGGALVGSLIDVTTERGLEQSLSQVAHDWRTTLDAIPMQLVLVDGDRRIVRVNAEARRSLGCDYLELIGTPLEAFAAWQPWSTVLAMCVEAGGGQPVLPRHSEPDPDGRVWEVTVNVLTSPSHLARRMIAVCREITDELRLQRAFEANERMASVGSLVAGVAHEVRNPLFGISAIADALELRLQGGDALPHLAMLRDVVARLSRLMNELLALGSTSQLELEQVAVTDVLEDARSACAALAMERGVAVVVEGDDGVVATLDRGRMAQVMQNLLDNAIRHAPAASWVEIAVTGGDEWLRLTVRDHGPGFGEHKARALEPFYSKRKGGTGLGLAIVAQIVQRHGGTVTLDNARDGGAVVRVDLPMAAP